ncbi:MAG: NapC/NirT family cytochrome c [Candidatus Acidiferrum sp.]
MSTIATVLLVLLTAVLAGVIVVRPAVTVSRAGKILAFCVLFFLPLFSLAVGMQNEMTRSESTAFCLSCHIMEPYGKSLHIDDPGYLAAAHFQNHRVPADEACYTCHTDYAMFGTIKAKLGGLRHLYVYYLGKPPLPENIKLYKPFSNQTCLHCHLGARSFEEGVVHNADPAMLPAIKANKVSCISSGCHDVVHNVGRWGDGVKFWDGGS